MAIVLTTLSGRPDFEVFRSRNAQFVADLPNLREYKRRRLEQLQGLNRRQQRAKVRSLLTDQRLLILYAYEALRKTGNLRTATADSISTFAADTNLFQSCNERQRIKYVRSRRRQREVYSFGPHKRLRQLFVSDVVRALHPPHASQKLFHGGMPAARRAVDAAYFQHDMRYCVEVDFVNFYGSIPWEGLADILRPLPNAVVRHVLWDLTIRRDGQGMDYHNHSPILWSDPHRIGPVGLPLGSACSPIAGECILAQFLRNVPSNQFVAYADNILLFGENETEVHALISSLSESVRTGVGAMRFRADEVLRLHSIEEMVNGFEFLGQYASMPSGDAASNDGFVWRPNTHKMMEYHIEEWLPEANETELDEAEAKVINWRRAYPEWPEGKEVETRSLAEIACLRYFRNPTPVHQRHAINAVITAVLTNETQIGPEFIIPDINPSYWRLRENFIITCHEWIDDVLDRQFQMP